MGSGTCRNADQRVTGLSVPPATVTLHRGEALPRCTAAPAPQHPIAPAPRTRSSPASGERNRPLFPQNKTPFCWQRRSAAGSQQGDDRLARSCRGRCLELTVLSPTPSDSNVSRPKKSRSGIAGRAAATHPRAGTGRRTRSFFYFLSNFWKRSEKLLHSVKNSFLAK